MNGDRQQTEKGAYPDIVSVIKLSDLYSVSLDELLKEDKKMIEHLDEATNGRGDKRGEEPQVAFKADRGRKFLVVWAVTAIGLGIDTVLQSRKFKRRTE